MAPILTEKYRNQMEPFIIQLTHQKHNHSLKNHKSTTNN